MTKIKNELNRLGFNAKIDINRHNLFRIFFVLYLKNMEIPGNLLVHGLKPSFRKVYANLQIDGELTIHQHGVSTINHKGMAIFEYLMKVYGNNDYVALETMARLVEPDVVKLTSLFDQHFCKEIIE